MRNHLSGSITIHRSSRHRSFCVRAQQILEGHNYPDEGSRANFRSALLHGWQAIWTSVSSGRFFFAFQPKVSVHTQVWSAALPRWAVSVLCGMRIGCAVLNVHLFRDGLSSSGLCACQAVETIEHFWLHFSDLCRPSCVFSQDVFYRTQLSTQTDSSLFPCFHRLR